RAQGIGAVRNPYPALAAMRAVAPVHRVDLRHLPRGGNPMTAPPEEIYTVLTWEGVYQVLRDGRRFSSKGYERTMGVCMGHTILAMDGEGHLRYRALISKAFTRRALERWEHALVRRVVEAYVDRLAGRGRADLVRELTFPFPVRVVASMIGLPEEEHDLFH